MSQTLTHSLWFSKPNHLSVGLSFRRGLSVLSAVLYHNIYWSHYFTFSSAVKKKKSIQIHIKPSYKQVVWVMNLFFQSEPNKALIGLMQWDLQTWIYIYLHTSHPKRVPFIAIVASEREGRKLTFTSYSIFLMICTISISNSCPFLEKVMLLFTLRAKIVRAIASALPHLKIIYHW